MPTTDHLYPLYTDSLQNTVQLNINLSYDLFEEMRIVKPSWEYKANPHNQPLSYGMTYDIISFLESYYGDEYAYGKRCFNKANEKGVFIHKNHREDIKKALQACKIPFIIDFFLDEFCFLISYYSWLIPKEEPLDYTSTLHGIFPIQPEEEGVEDFFEKREPAYKLIKKLVEDRTVHPAIRNRLQNWEYWKELKKRVQAYYRRVDELKTTSENINVMLLKQRAFNSFYCYLKYTVAPTMDSYIKDFGLISKYATANNLERDEAVADIIKKKMYINSERKLHQIVGVCFKLIGLIKTRVDATGYIHTYQEQLTKKNEVEPAPFMAHDEWKRLKKESRKKFNIRYNFERLRIYSARQKTVKKQAVS